MWQCDDDQFVTFEDDEGKPICFLCVTLEFTESCVDGYYVAGMKDFWPFFITVRWTTADWLVG
jgi:hypothetical protein